MDTENITNLFLQGSFGYGLIRTRDSNNNLAKSKYTTYSIMGGPVIYFNTSVGLEFTAGWNYFKTINEKSSNGSLLLGIGLQIYLEK